MIALALTAALLLIYNFKHCATNPMVYVNEVNQRLYKKHKLYLAGIPEAEYVAIIIIQTPEPTEKTLLIEHLFTHNSPYHIPAMLVIAVASYILIAGTSNKHAVTGGIALLIQSAIGYSLIGFFISIIYYFY